MSRVRILPEIVANRIAAGEVVERPASVVKELLENSLDAGARLIRVEVESGGKRMIRVIDDGSGMARDDALLAFERHATSKLRTADDLLSIATLGFRGEALPSIAAVARLLLETRTAEEEQGTRIEFNGGKLLSVKPAGLPTGTSVSVADIFYCVPARRSFLKSETTELGHVASLVTHYALAHPDRHFVLQTPSREIINAAPVTELSERVYQLFGRQALDELLEIPPTESPLHAVITEPELESDELAETVRVRGFASRPEVQRPNRNGIYIFVNRRLVRDRLLLHAISEAYRHIMPPNVFPAVLLFLELPYQEVDVNVHPAKIEVRFRHPQFVHDFARDAIKFALSHARPIAGFPADKESPESENGASAAGALAAAAGAAGISQSETQSGPLPASRLGPPRAMIPPLSSSVGIAEGFELTGAPDRPLPQRLQFDAGPAMEFSSAAGTAASASPLPMEAGSQPGSLPRPEEIADLKPLGQIKNSFIVAVNGEGLWIIDQHVAHERVLFEKHLRARREGELGGQRMLAPLVVELLPRQFATFDLIAEELRANGFEAEAMGQRSLAIHAAPAGIAAPDAERLLAEILDGVAREAQAISD